MIIFFIFLKSKFSHNSSFLPFFPFFLPFFPFLPLLPLIFFLAVLASAFFLASSSANISAIISSSKSRSASDYSSTTSAAPSAAMLQSFSSMVISPCLTFGFHVAIFPLRNLSAWLSIVDASNLPIKFAWSSFSGK